MRRRRNLYNVNDEDIVNCFWLITTVAKNAADGKRVMTDFNDAKIAKVVQS